MQSVVWVQEVLVSANSKLKSLLAVTQHLFKAPSMCSCGQAQISAEAVGESHWLYQVAQMGCVGQYLWEMSPCALAKPNPALVRISLRFSST